MRPRWRNFGVTDYPIVQDVQGLPPGGLVMRMRGDGERYVLRGTRFLARRNEML